MSRIPHETGNELYPSKLCKLKKSMTNKKSIVLETQNQATHSQKPARILTMETQQNTNESKLHSTDLGAEQLNNGITGKSEIEFGKFSKKIVFTNLSSRLLLLILFFFTVCELIVLVPCVADYRENWITNYLDEVSFKISFFNDLKTIPREDLSQLFNSTEVIAIAVKDENASKYLVTNEMPAKVDRTFNLTDLSFTNSIIQALDMLLFGGDRTLRLVGTLDSPSQEEFEVILYESVLRQAIVDYILKILSFSLLVSVFTSGIMFFIVRKMIAKPIVQLADSMKQFANSPNHDSLFIQHSSRKDELGQAMRQLRSLEQSFVETLDQHRQLADMGLSVAKINHDLRNLLSKTQLLFERFEGLQEPTVQKNIPIITLVLDHAVTYTEMILNYGKQQVESSNRKLFRVRDLVHEVSEIVLLDCKTDIDWINNVKSDILMDGDNDQIFRVLVNLLKNSIQAMESNGKSDGSNQLKIDANRQDGVVSVRISDSGPGISEPVKDKLFDAFQSFGKTNGTGLGLAIVSDLVQAHGGGIKVLDSDVGAVFEFWIPDRPA